VVISIERKTIGLIALVILILVGAIFTGYTLCHAMTPVKIGVLLPMTGDIDFKEPLEWAKDNINREGGIGGRQVELVYKDTGTGNATRMAQELLADSSIQIVIGPSTSTEVFSLAPQFIAQKKILISPTATSGDIVRAFGKKDYFWRTTQGDVAQVKTMVSILNGKGVKTVALLAENTTYGKTFHDWTGFFATEYGLNLASIEQFEPGSTDPDRYVARALEKNPEYLIAACGPSDAAAIKRALDRSGKPVKLLLADAAETPVLTTLLGTAAEGIEGTSPTADPTTGFSVAYQDRFGHAPDDYAAPAYDALLLAAYISARQDATFFESPADSARTVIYGNGTAKGWDAQDVHEALSLIRGGATPAISGTSGPLDYDIDYGVDPLVTWYSHWIVEDGQYRTVATYTSAKTGTGTKTGESVARSRASSRFMSSSLNTTGDGLPTIAKTGLWAVVVGPSRGWTNYRHQSDALNVYTLLRQNGVDDDHIILMIYDDIPTDSENPLKGDVHNIPKGQNLRSGAVVDYSGTNVSSETVRNVLTGTRTAQTPVVLESNESTNVFVYIASHGSPGEIVFRYDDAISTEEFTEMTSAMYANQKYRQVLFVIDTCFGESVATTITAPGIIYLTGAADNEPSLGAVYDMDIKQWLSDEFSSTAMSLIKTDTTLSIRDLYIAAYEKVTGSHVSMIVTDNTSIDQPVTNFLIP